MSYLDEIQIVYTVQRGAAVNFYKVQSGDTVMTSRIGLIILKKTTFIRRKKPSKSNGKFPLTARNQLALYRIQKQSASAKEAEQQQCHLR